MRVIAIGNGHTDFVTAIPFRPHTRIYLDIIYCGTNAKNKNIETDAEGSNRAYCVFESNRKEF